MALVTRENTVNTRRIFDGYIISLRQDTLQMPDGSHVTREIVEHNGGVVVACQPKADQVILVKQYRYSIDKEIIELPAGRIEIGEDPLICAQREIIEETGYQAKSWSELARFYSAPGFCNEILYLYRASDVSFVGKNLDVDEETDVLILPIERAWDMVLSADIQDAKTIAGLGLLRNS